MEIGYFPPKKSYCGYNAACRYSRKEKSVNYCFKIHKTSSVENSKLLLGFNSQFVPTINFLFSYKTYC